MQNVSFRTLEDFFEFLTEDEYAVTMVLRNIVLGCIPHAKEKLSYNVPYYHVHKAICFIWPSSILWGKKKIHDGVRFGFTSGYLMNDDIGYLDKGKRKQIYCKDFLRVEDIDIELLKSYIYAAVAVDEQSAKNKAITIRTKEKANTITTRRSSRQIEE